VLEELSKRLLRHQRPIRIAITGSLASGKSTALKAFRAAGYATASADQIVEQIYKRRAVTKSELLKRYSRSRTGIKKLEAWIHPQVKREVSKFLKNSRRSSVVEIPLLFEAGMQSHFDFIIYIFCPKLLRAKRALKRGMNSKLFQALDARQWSAYQKASLSNLVLHNWDKKKYKARAMQLAKFLRQVHN